MEYHVIDLEWTGAYPVPYNSSTELYELGEYKENILNNSGFYQIYGNHPIYGRDVLLYIGETKKSETTERSFFDRMSEHFSGKFWYFENLSIYIAPCKLDLEVHLAAESILIAAHKPALTIQHLNQAKESAQSVIVRNWGAKGSLLPECSGEYWRS